MIQPSAARSLDGLPWRFGRASIPAAPTEGLVGTSGKDRLGLERTGKRCVEGVCAYMFEGAKTAFAQHDADGQAVKEYISETSVLSMVLIYHAETYRVLSFPWRQCRARILHVGARSGHIGNLATGGHRPGSSLRSRWVGRGFAGFR